jgi:hypothetical protein
MSGSVEYGILCSALPLIPTEASTLHQEEEFLVRLWLLAREEAWVKGVEGRVAHEVRNELLTNSRQA